MKPVAEPPVKKRKKKGTKPAAAEDPAKKRKKKERTVRMKGMTKKATSKMNDVQNRLQEWSAARNFPQSAGSFLSNDNNNLI
jgi:hypothetical protein